MREKVLEGQPVIDERLFSALVTMIMVTTFITPPVLRWSIARAARMRSTSPARSSAAEIVGSG